MRLLLISLVMTLLAAVVTPIATAAEDQQQVTKPKIGLALSGGGARGAAHVGVIQVLEQMQIPIDYIAGTSMGAIVGGLYASGMSSDEIARQMEQIDWDAVFIDETDRPARPQRRKDDDRLYLAKGKAGVSEDGISLPGAVIRGQKLDLLLTALTLPVANIKDFDQLPIPFRAVAMDIATGEEVVLSSGDLPVAIRASMTIPAIFAPIKLDGRLLVDGGSANNLPISVAREMGADIVIAVDISTPLLAQDELKGVLDVISQLAGLLTRRNVDAQIKTLTKQDLLIIPALGDVVSTGDFNKIQEAIEIGKQAGEANKLKLATLSIDDNSYRTYLAVHHSEPWQEPIIKFIHFENHSTLDEQMLREHLGVEVGQPFDRDNIESGIATIYGLDIFESVRYDIVEENEESGIVVTVKQKTWGSDSIQAGLQLSSNFSGDSAFNLAFAYTKMPMNSLNGEWRTAFQVGEDPSIITEIYQPLDPAARYFINPRIFYESRTLRQYENDDSQANSEYDINDWGINLDAGRNLGDWGEFRLGYSRLRGKANVKIGAPDLSDFDFDDAYVSALVRMDTLDSLYFTRSGYIGSLEWLSGRESLGADDDYDQVQFQVGGAKSWDADTLLLTASYGTTLEGDDPLYKRYRLGGFMKLSGLELNQLSGQHFGLASLGYQRYLYRSNYFPLYAGAVLQAGNTWEEKSDISASNLIASGTAYVGADTPIGPLYLGYGLAEGGNNALYLFLGQPFF